MGHPHSKTLQNPTILNTTSDFEELKDSGVSTVKNDMGGIWITLPAFDGLGFAPYNNLSKYLNLEQSPPLTLTNPKNAPHLHLDEKTLIYTEKLLSMMPGNICDSFAISPGITSNPNLTSCPDNLANP